MGHEAIEAADNFFRNTWNAQRTQLPFMGRLHPDSLGNVANFCRPLMVPAVMSPVPSQPRSADSQAFINPAFLMAYPPLAHLPALASMHDNNSNGGGIFWTILSAMYIHPFFSTSIVTIVRLVDGIFARRLRWLLRDFKQGMSF